MPSYLAKLFEDLGKWIPTWIPTLATIVICLLFLRLLRWFLFRRREAEGIQGAASVAWQLFYVLCIISAIVAVIIATPLNPAEHGQLLTLLGLLLTGSIALSSTTFLGNAMAGMMLRSVGNFSPGDFLRVGKHFGRISEHGLLHTEIQTADRELTTLPNLFLVTHPVTIVDQTGTVVSATVSLGYDVHHEKATSTLLRAAKASNLDKAFVQIRELGDFSILYRVAGFLPDVKYLLSARSALRASMIDALHEDGIEIISPTFANERLINQDAIVAGQSERRVNRPMAAPIEDLVFDKAERAHSLEEMRKRILELTKIRTNLAKELETAGPEELARLQLNDRLLAEEIERVTIAINAAEPTK